MSAIYSTRRDAIQCEIIDAILAGDVESIDEYDVEQIAAEVIGDYASGYACKVSVEEFWAIVEANARPLTTYAVVASCSYRDEVRRYDIDAPTEAVAKTQATERYAGESTIGVDIDDVLTEIV